MMRMKYGHDMLRHGAPSTGPSELDDYVAISMCITVYEVLQGRKPPSRYSKSYDTYVHPVIVVSLEYTIYRIC